MEAIHSHYVRWSLACISAGYAAPSANERNGTNYEEGLQCVPRVRTDIGPPRDGCVDSGLRRGRRRLRNAATATSPHYRKCGPGGGNSVARRNIEFRRHCFQHYRYRCHLERRWRCQRFGSSRNHFRRWSLYSARGSPSGRDGTCDCHEPRRRFQIRHRFRDCSQ